MQTNEYDATDEVEYRSKVLAAINELEANFLQWGEDYGQGDEAIGILTAQLRNHAQQFREKVQSMNIRELTHACETISSFSLALLTNIAVFADQDELLHHIEQAKQKLPAHYRHIAPTAVLNPTIH